MRLAALILALGFLAALATALLWRGKPPANALSISPTRQMLFQTSNRLETVLLTLAVTNNTRSPLAGRLRLTVEVDPNAFGFADPDFVTPFRLRPSSGTLCTVQYNPHCGRLVLSGDYMRVRGGVESKIRALLHMLQVPGVSAFL